MATTTLSFSGGGSGGVNTNVSLNTSGSRDTLVQHLHSSFYKNTDNHSSGSLYSKDDEDDDDMFYDALEINPSWTSPLTPGSFTSHSPRFHLIRSNGGISHSGMEKLSPLPSSTPLPSPSAPIAPIREMSTSPQSALSTLSKDSPTQTQSTVSSPSTSPNISPSSSPSMGSLHYHPSSHQQNQQQQQQQQGTIKAKRNSKVLNIIKSKREELHNLFSSNKEKVVDITQSESSIEQPKEQHHLPLHSQSQPQLSNQQQHPESGSRFRKLIKRYSQAENNVEPNILNMSNGINMNNTNNNNNIINSNSNNSGSSSSNHSNNNNNEKHERRVSRWLKNLHNNNNVPNNLKKKSKELSTDFNLIQTMKGHSGSIWSIDFNIDGTLLATGGSDGIVRIWKVSSNIGEDEFFKSETHVQLSGHTGHILDIKWINNSQLLTSSIDTNVKLWDVDKGECLRTFEHNDIVVSISLDISQSMFYSSTLDGFIRKWTINSKNDDQPIIEAEVGEFITTISLSIKPHYLIVTSHLGNILIYSPANLELIHKFNISENHTGKKGKGPKITGVNLITSPSYEDCLLVTSNDSCIRQYSLKDFKRICKYKGMHLENYQVKPIISPDRKTILMGSEDHHIYIWENFIEHPSYNEEAKPHKLTIECCEFITAMNKPITATIFAPSSIESNIGKYLISTDTTGSILVYNKLQ